jgi:hypothetical protein
MNKLMRSWVMFAVLASTDSGSAIAQDGPGKGYAHVSQGAYSVVAEVRAKPGKEVFANQADFEAHNAMPYVRDWFAKIRDLADGGVKVMRMEILAEPR